VIGTKGPLYDCVLTGTVSGIAVKLEEFHAHVPMSVKLSGTRTTGKTDTVALTAGVGGFYPQGATSAKFSASLPVTGAQAGNVAMSERPSHGFGWEAIRADRHARRRGPAQPGGAGH
jgi:hypothetical protein